MHNTIIVVGLFGHLSNHARLCSNTRAPRSSRSRRPR